MSHDHDDGRLGWNLEDDTVLERGVDLQSLAGRKCEEILRYTIGLVAQIRSARYQRDNDVALNCYQTTLTLWNKPRVRRHLPISLNGTLFGFVLIGEDLQENHGLEWLVMRPKAARLPRKIRAYPLWSPNFSPRTIVAIDENQKSRARLALDFSLVNEFFA